MKQLGAFGGGSCQESHQDAEPLSVGAGASHPTVTGGGPVFIWRGSVGSFIDPQRETCFKAVHFPSVIIKTQVETGEFLTPLQVINYDDIKHVPSLFS